MQPYLCPLVMQHVHASSPGAACACRYPLDIFGAGNAAMKQALRKGGPADLNIYVTQLNNGGIIGCARLPTHAPAHRTQRWLCSGQARLWMVQHMMQWTSSAAQHARRRFTHDWHDAGCDSAALTTRPGCLCAAIKLRVWRITTGDPFWCRVATNPWGTGVGYVPFDGIIIDAGTLPGSWYGGYNVGMNAVHESGHW